MSEQWELYVCAMGEKTAYISFDNGIRDQINTLPQKHALKIRAMIKNPTSAGLPQKEEFNVLNAIEDALTAFLSQHDGVYLGRITVDGARYFHGLCDASEILVKAFCADMHEKHGRAVGYLRELDPERTVYWKELYPTEHDWQVIQDMKVLDNLQKEGDTLTISRRIDHWLGFKDEASRTHFMAWVESNGFGVAGMTERDADKPLRFRVQIFHEAVPRLDEITHHTIRLHDVAKEYGGDYDGWETSVQKG